MRLARRSSWSSLYLTRDEFVGMDDEFRVSSRAELANVHALPVSVAIHAIGHDAVQQQVGAIDEWEHEAEQRGDADQLGEHVAGAIAIGEMAEDSDGEQSPQAGAGVD